MKRFKVRGYGGPELQDPERFGYKGTEEVIQHEVAKFVRHDGQVVTCVAGDAWFYATIEATFCEVPVWWQVLEV